MTRFSDSLKSKQFLVTAELSPPKGTDLGPIFDKAEYLKDVVCAFNLTDSHRSMMSMSPLAVAHLLAGRGIESILQITCRDRNKIALQADVLAASALGASNILCLTGDHPKSGDHPDAKAVFDMEAVALLRTIKSLESGVDMNGNPLNGTPEYCAGAVANPGAEDLGKELARLEDKLDAGAKFFQTQAVYDPSTLERFMKVAEQYKVPILAGYIMLKSAKMAKDFDENLPGVSVPNWIIENLDKAEDRGLASVEIAAKVIHDIKDICRGVHIMAIGWEKRIPDVIQRAELP